MAEIKGLGSDGTKRLMNIVRQNESGGHGGYSNAGNQLGYIGGYQMGTGALIDAGLVKPSAGKSNSALNDPGNWVPPYDKQSFLANPALQDQAFITYKNGQYSALKSAGFINESTSPADVAGYLSASQFGVGNLQKSKKEGGNPDGLDYVDANKVPARKFFEDGKAAFLGTKSAPDAKVAIKSEQAPEAPSLRAARTLKRTSIGDNGVPKISISTYGGDQTKEHIGPIPNPLEKFSTYNTLITLSCLTRDQYNAPDSGYSYIDNNLGKIILSSGGVNPENRVQTAHTTTSNKSGKYDFYIDNLVLDSIIKYNPVSQTSNVNTLTFTVYEPYSMGMFLEALGIAADECGYAQFTEAPFLLTIKFIGYDSSGNLISDSTDKTLVRHIPIRLQEADMRITGAGSTYNVKATAWNEVALTDTAKLLKEDMCISGSSVAEILQSGPNSLQYWLNQIYEDLASADNNSSDGKKITRHEVVIVFPDIKNLPPIDTGKEPKSATRDPSTGTAVGNAIPIGLSRNNTTSLLVQDSKYMNEIGLSKMGFDFSTGGTGGPAEMDKITDSNGRVLRAINYYDTKVQSFRFPQNTSILTAITEIMLMSEYCKKNATTKPKNGMISWFRIETQTVLKQPTGGNSATGDAPKLFIYKVVPYLVSEACFLSPNAIPDYSESRKYAAKHYDYIYTGKNTDVLSFDLQMKFAPFTELYADRGNNSINSAASVLSSTKSVDTQIKPSTSSTDKRPLNPTGSVRVGSITDSPTGVTHGGPVADVRSRYAAMVHDSLINSSVAMLDADLEILGDPYYIADSGLGNFTDPNPRNFNIASNDSMNYQSGEVDIVVNFRTPTDYDSASGTLDFSAAEKVEHFSGLYFINTMTTKINQNKFTITLGISRRINQDIPNIDKSNDAVQSVTIGGGRGVVNPEAVKPAAYNQVRGANEPAAAITGNNKPQ